mmetsp:Transcript_123050/g.241364  ORF Transcript_123050/g.241364 Transcript_123050/m.241364 type:complete len:364 (+) Transcript_123050:27-1118(+)|eukprot:CAMPEP_0170400292 /NCGR_PEP_ID=MMETSP0117_2-20130122/24426_1 /TAXON_ID=400756 /ORGANISM="Durinskia baltica, Strain CSIRO CS-38" /LENGTH=363 /DNA_ID=CAMNT_0010657043 /DNA_START=26 /DNA_END=1117 /DNA_ORIENTATION=+
MNAPKKSSQEGDIKFPNPPQDGISSLSVNGNEQSPTNMVIATSWDNSVNCYELQYSPQQQLSGIVPQAQTKHEGPVLCSDISNDNVTVFTGGCDNAVRMWNVTQGAAGSQVIGKHDAPIRNVKFIPEKNVVVTGSWDKTIKVWDMRQPTAAATLALSERVYCMDARSQILVAATADKQMHVFDLTAGNKVSEFKSPLTYQTKSLCIFHDCKGFAAGSIEGRVALEYFDELQNKAMLANNPNAPKPATKNFAFKCHRDGADIFAINSLHFHPYNTFASAGSDGVVTFWDKDARQKLTSHDMLKKQCPITDVKFNMMGNLCFYSASYDWSRGAENNDPTKMVPNIYVHSVPSAEVAPKDPKSLKK